MATHQSSTTVSAECLAYHVNPFQLCLECYLFNPKEAFCEFKTVNDKEVIHFPQWNFYIHSDASSEWIPRKELHSLGDIFRLLCIPKANYTYNYLQTLSSRYINIVERQKIYQVLQLGLEHAPKEALNASTDAFPFDQSQPLLGPIQSKVIPSESSQPAPASSTSIHSLSSSYPDQQSAHVIIPKYLPTPTEFQSTNSLVKALEHVEINLSSVSQSISSNSQFKLTQPYEHAFEKILLQYKEMKKKKQQSAQATQGSKHFISKKTTAIYSNDPISTKVKSMCVIDEICIKYRRRPIIIIPSSPSALLNRFNVLEFLQNGRFIEPAEAAKKAALGPREINTHPFGANEIVHKIRGKEFKFLLMESTYTSRFKESDWKSIVAVLLQGGKWQFNGWPFKNFIDLFSAIKGCYFVYDSDTVSSELLKWSIKVFRISRCHRHNDAAIQSEFWDYLEQFLIRPRPHNFLSTDCLSAK